MRNHLFPITLILPLLASGCGGSSDPAELTREGVTALNAGDYDQAYAALDKAVRAMEPGDPGFAEAAVGRVRALAQRDPAGAKSEFLALASAHRSVIDERDFEIVADTLRSQHAFGEAVEVLAEGMKRFPESPKLAALRDQMAKEAEQEGDSEALAALKGLGYIGD